MEPPHRARNAEFERRERDSYVFLRHVYTLAGGRPGASLSGDQVAAQLAFDTSEALGLINYLVAGGLLLRGDRGKIVLTARGTEYIEHLARRRNSVRLMAPGGREA
ncbi:MAG: hypothetical protein WD942_03080 [Dehalococcoidia bacterium]